jgi:tetratricopeptide (TPR) repeat protein
LSSKLSKLKQDAYQAGKKHNWAEAMAIYERILELDKSNPSLLNELGDICLKNADPAKAVRHFLNAASKYRQTGLMNNAVAVYKKVLRHDAENLNAHWFLAEIRAGQGLLVDGEAHADRFLAAAEQVSGEIKEIFLKRCIQLLSLYPASRVLLERIQGVFRIWNLPLEEARATCLLACERLAAGEPQAARELAERAVHTSPEVVSYGEYTLWLETIGEAVPVVVSHDVNTVALDAITEPTPAPAAANFELDAFAQFLANDTPAAAMPAAPRDDERCFDLSCDDGEETSFAGLSAELAEPAEVATPRGSVDLLQEILDEAGDDFGDRGEQQIDTITSEIGAQLGGASAADPESLYQQGLIYLEMGMHGQAADAFERASDGAGWTLRACEMWGIALLRDERYEESLMAFARGLASVEGRPREVIGMMYHAAQACERLGHADDALAWYERCHAIDPAFLDVRFRLGLPVA